VLVREAQRTDASEWLRLRSLLWPDGAHDHAPEISAFFEGKGRGIDVVFVAAEGERLVGLLEVSIRSYAEGCTSDRVAYLEGWYVDEASRGRGVGRALVEAAESWARKERITEMASDTEVANDASASAHAALGFEEVEAIRVFRKNLLRAELLGMAERDARVRSELASDGSLFHGYHSGMEAVHRENARRLEAIVSAHGWPGRSLVGEDGEEAAWLILQHAIGEPELQRKGLRWLEEAARAGEAPAWQAATLKDRIRAFEGRKQLYGTQVGWKDDGTLGPDPDIEELEGADERRRRVGLSDLEASLARHREEARRSGEKPPDDLARFRRERDAWARRVGWRKNEP
jgi:GNAT superfamily N-acetyltransferase